MARDYGQIQHRIWADPDWRALDADAQLLYLLLLSQPSMNQAGVLPVQWRKWAGCVANWDTGAVTKTMHRLADARFVVLDEDHEEVLVRSFIRNDGSYRIPGVLKSALRFAEAVVSPAIRSALAAELGRLPELEGKTAADGMAAIAATRAALEPIGDPFPDPFREPIPDPIGNGFVSNPSRNGSTTAKQPIPEPIPDPIPEPSLSVSGSVSGLSLVRNQGGENLPHPPRCAKHDDLPIGDEPPCGACKRLRENWELTRAEASKPPPKPPWCGACTKSTRLVETDDGVARCQSCHPLAVSA